MQSHEVFSAVAREYSPGVRMKWFGLFSLLLMSSIFHPAVAQIATSGSGSAAGAAVSSSSAGQSQANASPYQGSVQAGQATSGVLSLSLDEAIQRGLRQNLGLILSGTSEQS